MQNSHRFLSLWANLIVSYYERNCWGAKIIRDSTNFEIEYNHTLEIFTFNDGVVNEIEKSHFDSIISHVVKRIDEILDYGNSQHLDYVKIVCNKLQGKLSEVAEIKSDTLDDLDYKNNGWGWSLVMPKKQPKKNYLEVWDKPITGEDGKHVYILQNRWLFQYWIWWGILNGSRRA